VRVRSYPSREATPRARGPDPLDLLTAQAVLSELPAEVQATLLRLLANEDSKED